jgi:hypothetical protein
LPKDISGDGIGDLPGREGMLLKMGEIELREKLTGGLGGVFSARGELFGRLNQRRNLTIACRGN